MEIYKEFTFEAAHRLPNVPDGHKCGRCWMILPEVGHNPRHTDLCNRCSDALDT